MLRTRRVVESGCEEWAKTFIKDQAPEYYDGADDAWACDDDGGSLGARSVAFSLVLRLASSGLGQRLRGWCGGELSSLHLPCPSSTRQLRTVFYTIRIAMWHSKSTI